MIPEQDPAAAPPPHRADAQPADATTDDEQPPTDATPDEQPRADAAAGDAPAGDARPKGAGVSSDGTRPEGTGTPSGGEHPGRRRVTRARIVWTVAAMLVAAVAATAVLQGIGAAQAEDARARLETERALRLEVSGAASAFSKALLSYDYRDLQTTRATLTAQATGDFLATYDTAFGGAMAQVIVKLKATSQATVREVYLADVDEATAHAIVVVDQQVNTSEAIRSVKDSHLKIALVKEKGIWKVHDVTVLGAASEDQYTLDGGDKKKKD